MPSQSPTAPRRSWRQAWLVYLEPASLRMLALGFSAGLPLLLAQLGVAAGLVGMALAEIGRAHV